jgi:hypothetical protein
MLNRTAETTDGLKHIRLRQSATMIALIGIIMVLAAALRVYHLDLLSLEGDELFSRYYLHLLGWGFAGDRACGSNPTHRYIMPSWKAVSRCSGTAPRRCAR